MSITTTFITRYVRHHDSAVTWHERFFGREPDAAPMPSCREWHLPGGVIFQVIEDPSRDGTQSVAFAVEDLDAELQRLSAAGVEHGEVWDVEGIDGLRYAPVPDPAGGEIGLLNRIAMNPTAQER